MENGMMAGKSARGALAFRLTLGFCLGLAVLAEAQPAGAPPQDPALLNSLDSLKRVITRRILSDGEKKEIRSCDREKSLFLKECRGSDSAYAQVDRQISEAKLRGADPNDPAVASLMERKFSYEKSCDDRYTATPRGKQCLAGEGKRRVALEKALKKDKQYQALLKKTEAMGPKPI
ncbi:MAG: hypothetical protein JWP91_435 [Fibrobacteres bacterium]|nr:hypothetical protein [Fibrobacterota bacterium]